MMIQLPDAEATAALGAALAARLSELPGGVLYLHGELGAGKTTLARALLRALGVQGSIRSPTYTLIEPYRLELRGALREAVHLDLYRLNDPRELHNLGLDDYPPATTLWLVEWPEKAERGEGGNLLPPPLVRVRLGTVGAGREAEVQWLGQMDPGGLSQKPP